MLIIDYYPRVDVVLLQDGTERNIESLSLIDAVMPDVVELRKGGIKVPMQVKPEGTNGDELSQQFCTSTVLLFIIRVVFE